MRLFEALLLAASLIGICFCYENKTITEYLDENGYNTLSGLLTKSGLSTVLNGTGIYTIFAPTDAAFAAADPNTLAAYTGSDTELERLLKYHLIAEFFLLHMIGYTNSKPSMEGEMLDFTTTSGFAVNGVKIGTPNDVVVRNGIVHPIDAVLFPHLDSNLNIAQTMIMDEARLKDFFVSLLLTDLIGFLEAPGSEFTVFAPNNSAWYTFDWDNVNQVDANASYVYKELYKYHMVAGTHFFRDLTPGVPLYSIHGQPLTFTTGASGLMVDSATFIDKDIRASNGVIHIIDSIIAPPDLMKS